METEYIISEMQNTYKQKSNYKSILENIIGERRILIWGACERSENIVKFLSLISDSFLFGGYIDSNSQIASYNGKTCYSPKEINKEKDFIIFSLLNRYDEIEHFLAEKGFVENEDFLYPFLHNASITHTDGYYCDIYGNVILGNVTGFTVNFKGFGNFLKIGNDCEIDNSVIFNIFNYSYVNLGNNLKILANARFRVAENSYVWFGNNIFLNLNFSIGASNFTKVIIDDGLSCEFNFNFMGCQKSEFVVGKDCMFSYDIDILGCDAHMLYDLEKRENINKRKDYTIKIGEHVWIGKGTKIMYGADIGSGSVVGFGSFVNKKFPNNVALAGNPIRIVRKNVAWHRQVYPFLEEEEAYKKFDFRL